MTASQLNLAPTAATRAEDAPAQRPPARDWIARAVFYGGAFALIALMFSVERPEVVGGLTALLMLLLLLMKMPVGIAMATAGLLGIWSLASLRQVGATLAKLPYDTTASWSLSVLPMFIFMGVMLWRSGVTERLYLAARHWFGFVPGGLAVATNVAGAGLGAVSGSSVAIAYSLGRVGIPEMLRAGYHPRLATAAVLTGGTGGQLIPPSILMVVYAGVVQVPVGPQLLAGLVPGVALHMLFAILIIGIALAFPAMVGKGPGGHGHQTSTWRDRFTSLAGVWPLPILIAVIVVGLYGGFFTATEAGAVGAFGALLIAGWTLKKGLWTGVRTALGDTLSSVGAIFLMLIGAMIFNRLLVMSGAARWLTNAIQELNISRVTFLLLLMVAFLLLGMFMESLSMMLVTVPILMPALAHFDISLLWFGVFVVALGELAQVTPPVGLLAFVVHRLSQRPEVNLGKRITLGDVFIGVSWFIPISMAGLVLIIFFPGLIEAPF
ncbi:TRAP transporter large permease [Blastococcus sp. SYSU DS0973]